MSRVEQILEVVPATFRAEVLKKLKLIQLSSYIEGWNARELSEPCDDELDPTHPMQEAK
jgi:hypothetical protein